MSPVQDSPFPVYPGLHEHVKEPMVFRQAALGSQGDDIHSLISNKQSHHDS